MMNKVEFSIAAHAVWAPGLVTDQAWTDWAKSPFVIEGANEPGVSAMPSMLRRRAGFLGKMALEVAYQCLDGQENDPRDIPTIFCSRHGDVSRALEQLSNVVNNEPLSPMHFGLTVHNATAGLFSIARKDQANHIALSAGQCTIEHGVIEACGLLADGEARVLLVSYDNCLPALFAPYEDCKEQPHAWAWLMAPATTEVTPGVSHDVIQLSWKRAQSDLQVPHQAPQTTMPASLAVLKFYLRKDPLLERHVEHRQWCWSRHA